MTTLGELEISTAGIELLRIFGVSATFYPLIGNPVENITVLKDSFIDDQPRGIESRASETVTTIEGPLADIGKVPTRKDKFLIDSEYWEVAEQIENDEIWYKVTVLCD